MQGHAGPVPPSRWSNTWNHQHVPASFSGPKDSRGDSAPLRSRPCARSLRLRSPKGSPHGGDSLFSLHTPPASRGPFRKRPSTERVDAPHPARRPTEAYPQRYGEGGQRRRGGCSGPRMPGSEGMALWMPVACGARGGGRREAVLYAGERNRQRAGEDRERSLSGIPRELGPWSTYEDSAGGGLRLILGVALVTEGPLVLPEPRGNVPSVVVVPEIVARGVEVTNEERKRATGMPGSSLFDSSTMNIHRVGSRSS